MRLGRILLIVLAVAVILGLGVLAWHTARGGVPFAGGLAFNLPFGSIFSPNITPDKDTGIGGWSDAQFLGALHRGVDDQGQPLYPAMPYAAFTYMTDADGLAIKA